MQKRIFGRTAGFLLILVLGVTFSGCTAVYCIKPMGETPVSIEPEDWDGSWMHDDGFINIKVNDAEKGTFEAAWIENKKLESVNVQLQSCGDWFFGSSLDSAEKQRYIWGRIKKEGQQLVIWAPDVDKFKVLVEEKILPGKVDSDGNVSLGELSSEHMKIIASEKKGVLFEWDDPVVLFRISEK